MRRNPLLYAGLAALTLVVLIALWVVGMNRNASNPDRLDEKSINGSRTAESPIAKPDDVARRCASQSIYDLVGRELFRQAASNRGRDQATFDRIANVAAVRVDNPLLKRRDDGLDTIVCGGRVSVDLPPGVAVAGGRRTISGDLDYAIQPSADEQGQVVTLSGADTIVAALATIGRSSDMAAPIAPPAPTIALPGSAPVAPAPPPPSPRPSASPPPPAPSPAQANANPSFNCARAQRPGERVVCADAGLATLDRQMADQYNRAARSADADQRAMLLRTASRFYGYRDGCRSNDCVADAYRGRMREIDDIMAGRWGAR